MPRTIVDAEVDRDGRRHRDLVEWETADRDHARRRPRHHHDPGDDRRSSASRTGRDSGEPAPARDRCWPRPRRRAGPGPRSRAGPAGPGTASPRCPASPARRRAGAMARRPASPRPRRAGWSRQQERSGRRRGIRVPERARPPAAGGDGRGAPGRRRTRAVPRARVPGRAPFRGRYQISRASARQDEDPGAERDRRHRIGQMRAASLGRVLVVACVEALVDASVVVSSMARASGCASTTSSAGRARVTGRATGHPARGRAVDRVEPRCGRGIWRPRARSGRPARPSRSPISRATGHPARRRRRRRDPAAGRARGRPHRHVAPRRPPRDPRALASP